MTSAHDNSTLSRCMFVKGAALAGLGAAVAGNSGALFGSVPAASAEEMAKASEEKIVWNHCAINCPGRCALKLHIKDDELVRVETYATDTDDMDDVQPRACLRGRAYRAWVNHPDRIYYPMKRVEGTKRGDGKYEQISWEEVIQIIADNYNSVMENYGPEAFYLNYCTGNYGMTARPWQRLLAICMLPILTGNIGLPGTSTGLREGSYSINLKGLPNGTNPCSTGISVFNMVHAIDRGPEMTGVADGVKGAEVLPYDLKFIINWAGNCITNQNGDINWVHDVMSDDSKAQFVLGSVSSNPSRYQQSSLLVSRVG